MTSPLPKIEKGIPIPPDERSSRRLFLETLEIGFCFVCDDAAEINRLRGTAFNLGMKLRARKCEGGWRVWRVV